MVFSRQEEPWRSNTKGGLVLIPEHGTTHLSVDSTSDQDIQYHKWIILWLILFYYIIKLVSFRGSYILL